MHLILWQVFEPLTTENASKGIEDAAVAELADALDSKVLAV